MKTKNNFNPPTRIIVRSVIAFSVMTWLYLFFRMLLPYYFLLFEQKTLELVAYFFNVVFPAAIIGIITAFIIIFCIISSYMVLRWIIYK